MSSKRPAAARTGRPSSAPRQQGTTDVTTALTRNRSNPPSVVELSNTPENEDEVTGDEEDQDTHIQEEEEEEEEEEEAAATAAGSRSSASVSPSASNSEAVPSPAARPSWQRLMQSQAVSDDSKEAKAPVPTSGRSELVATLLKRAEQPAARASVEAVQQDQALMMLVLAELLQNGVHKSVEALADEAMASSELHSYLWRRFTTLLVNEGGLIDFATIKGSRRDWAVDFARQYVSPSGRRIGNSEEAKFVRRIVSSKSLTNFFNNRRGDIRRSVGALLAKVRSMGIFVLIGQRKVTAQGAIVDQAEASGEPTQAAYVLARLNAWLRRIVMLEKSCTWCPKEYHDTFASQVAEQMLKHPAVDDWFQALLPRGLPAADVL